ANDIAGQSLPTILSQASGSTFALGATTVTASTTDSLGNTASASFTVTVVDTTPPVLSLPAELVVEATGPTGALVTFPAGTATDFVDPNPLVAYDFPSGFFPVGTTVVTASAIDASGNASTAAFTVTVVDNTPPVVLAPVDLVVEADAPGGAAVTL